MLNKEFGMEASIPFLLNSRINILNIFQDIYISRNVKFNSYNPLFYNFVIIDSKIKRFKRGNSGITQ